MNMPLIGTLFSNRPYHWRLLLFTVIKTFLLVTEAPVVGKNCTIRSHNM